MQISYLFYALAILVVLLALYLAAKTNILKDSDINQPEGKEKMYSFSRTQGLWWTVIVAFCFIWGCGLAPHHILQLNATCLTLLGAGISTTVAGTVIDLHDKSQQLPRFQDKIESKNFFIDILRDSANNNISIHRFQSLVFNVVYGIVFVVAFFDEGATKFPSFDSATLGLLGISASAYLATKAVAENKQLPEVKK